MTSPRRVRRRTLLGAVAMTLGAPKGVVSAGAAFVPPTPERGPILGPFLCRATDRSCGVYFELANDRPTRAVTIAGRPARFSEPEPGIVIATFSGLAAGSRIPYRVEFESGFVVEGLLATYPRPVADARLAFGADFHPWSRPYAVCDVIRSVRPHAFFALGDQIYADSSLAEAAEPTEAAYAEHYRANFTEPALARLFAEVPTVLTWDDHELWNDADSGLDPTRRAAATAAYHRYQRVRGLGDTLEQQVRVGVAEVFVLDTRTARDLNAAPDGPRKTMLGEAQFEALARFLRESEAPLRVIASPTPFHRYVTNGADAFDGGYAYERDLIFAEIGRRPDGVLLVSGDAHYPACIRHTLPGGASVLELMATPTAAYVRAPPANLGSDVLFLEHDVRGFGLVDAHVTAGRLAWRIAFVDETGRELFSAEGP